MRHKVAGMALVTLGILLFFSTASYPEDVSKQLLGVKDQMGKADTLYGIGKYDEAFKIYQQIAAKYPETRFGTKALYQIGQCLTTQSKYKEAVSVFINLVRKYPRSDWASQALYRAGCLEAGLLKHPDKGFELWRTVIERYPNKGAAADALFNMAVALWLKGNTKEALKGFEQLIDRYPRSKRIEFAKQYVELLKKNKNAKLIE